MHIDDNAWSARSAEAELLTAIASPSMLIRSRDPDTTVPAETATPESCRDHGEQQRGRGKQEHIHGRRLSTLRFYDPVAGIVFDWSGLIGVHHANRSEQAVRWA